MGAQRKSWTEKQGHYCIAARQSKQKDVARQFDVSPSVVSESLKAARCEDLMEAERAAMMFLAQLKTQAPCTPG